MSIARLGTAALAALVALGSSELALAQDRPDDDRFFVFKDKADREKTDVQGTLTWTNFIYRETSGGVDPLVGDAQVIAAEVAAPVVRTFTDLRARMTAKHLGGSKWDFRGDVRGRLVPLEARPDAADQPAGEPTERRVQSGSFSGNEYEVRELALGYNGKKYDAFLGRQFVHELASTKFDGLRLEYKSNEKWRYMVFGGLFPSRISRSVQDDYPREAPEMVGGEFGKRTYPIVGGAGAAYRFQKYYGSFGVVGIMPMGNDINDGLQTERNRIFATASGYWRQSTKLDIYHYAVVDGEGADGPQATNLTLGFQWAPQFSFRITGSINHTDTETLNVVAQNRLEDPDPNAAEPGLANVVINNLQVARLSQDSARLGISAGFKQNRFELSTYGEARRRPQVSIRRGNADDAMNVLVIPSAQAADLTISAVDRRSWQDMRIGLSFSQTFDIGSDNVNRSNFQIARAVASRQIRDGKGEVEGSFNYISSKDDNPGSTGMFCNGLGTLDAAAVQTGECYGSSAATSFRFGGVLSYRLKPQWLLIITAAAGIQSITVDNAAGDRVKLPNILVTTGFGRLAYRF